MLRSGKKGGHESPYKYIHIKIKIGKDLAKQVTWSFSSLQLFGFWWVCVNDSLTGVEHKIVFYSCRSSTTSFDVYEI